VAVFEDLIGLHREHCLCYRCEKYYPDTPENCWLAEEIYRMNKKYNLVTPVWECRLFETKIKHLEIKVDDSQAPAPQPQP
jgi:hypothetical protein